VGPNGSPGSDAAQEVANKVLGGGKNARKHSRGRADTRRGERLKNSEYWTRDQPPIDKREMTGKCKVMNQLNRRGITLPDPCHAGGVVKVAGRR